MIDPGCFYLSPYTDILSGAWLCILRTIQYVCFHSLKVLNDSQCNALCLPTPLIAYPCAGGKNLRQRKVWKHVKTHGAWKTRERESVCTDKRVLSMANYQSRFTTTRLQRTNIDMCLKVCFVDDSWGYRPSFMTLCRRMDNGQIAMRTWAILPKSLVPIQINVGLDLDIPGPLKVVWSGYTKPNEQHPVGGSRMGFLFQTFRFLHVSQVSLSRTWTTDSAITLAMTAFSQTLPFSPQTRSVSPMVDCFAQVTIKTQAAAAFSLLSWSLRVLPTTCFARGAFGLFFKNVLVSMFVYGIFLNHNTSQTTPHELLVFLVKSKWGLLAVIQELRELEPYAVMRTLLLVLVLRYVTRHNWGCARPTNAKTIFVALASTAPVQGQRSRQMASFVV